MKEPWQTFTIENVLKMKDELAQAQARIKELEALVREMGDLLSYAGQTLTVVAALHQRPKDEHLAQIIEILDRPIVKKIMEKT